MNAPVTRHAFVAAVLNAYLSGIENAYEAYQNAGQVIAEGENDIAFVVRCLHEEYDHHSLSRCPHLCIYGDYYKDGLVSNPVPRFAQGFFMLKGIGIHAGDGYKDTTELGEVVYAWNREKPTPYAPGQFDRIGHTTWSASVAQYRFEPATFEEVRAYVDGLFNENRALKEKLEGRDTWAGVLAQTGNGQKETS